MGYEMKLVTYEQTREDFFRDEMAKAETQVRIWQSRMQAAKNPIQEMEAHDNASNAAWVYNYYKDAIEVLSSMPKWISVEERLPENDDDYLVFTSEANEVELATYYGDGEWLTPDLGNLTRFVTHWMPLPEPPKEG